MLPLRLGTKSTISTGIVEFYPCVGTRYDNANNSLLSSMNLR
nr:hypothetical protein [uncultured Romboutsia sp.]